MSDRDAQLDQITAEFRDGVNQYVGWFRERVAMGGSPEQATADLAVRFADSGLIREALAAIAASAIAQLGTTEKPGGVL